MKWPTALVALAIVLAGSPIVARQSSTDDLKGRAVTLRACVIPGISNSVLLSKVQIPPTAVAVSPHAVKYLFDKPGEFRRASQGSLEHSWQCRDIGRTDQTFKQKKPHISVVIKLVCQQQKSDGAI